MSRFRSIRYCFLLVFCIVTIMGLRASDSGLNALNTPGIVISNSSNPAPGYVFTVIKADGKGHIIAFDSEGTIVFYRRFPNNVEHVKVWPDSCISYYDFPTRGFIILDKRQNIKDTIRMVSRYKADFHDFYRLPSGHTILICYDSQIIDMRKIVEGGDPSATVSTLVMQELDENGNLILQWKSLDHIDLLDSYADLTAQTIDYIHPNSMFPDANNTLILSSRNTSEITKINMTDGSIIWRMGGKNNQFTRLGDPKGFTGQHAVSLRENGNLLLFDNSINLETDPWLAKPGDPTKSEFVFAEEPSLASRGVEYTLSESSKTITQVREFYHIPEYHTNNMGSIQGLPNGNALISWGSATASPGMDITEYDHEGKLTFEAGIIGISSKFYTAGKYPFNTEYFTLSNDSILFGSILAGTSDTMELIIQNNGEQSVIISSVIHDHPAFSVDASFPIHIDPGAEHKLNIRFHPDVKGLQQEIISICSDTDTSRIAQQVILIGTGEYPLFSETIQQGEISISPNPANELLVVKNITAGLRVRIINMAGQVVFETLSSGNELHINLESITKGIYTLQLTGNQGQFRTERFIRQ